MGFKATGECPKGKKMEGKCKGCRDGEGTLKYVCASQCDAYKKYVKEKIH